MDCSSHPEEDEQGNSTHRKCDYCSFANTWSNFSEEIAKLSSDDLITDYNEIKEDAVRSLIFIEESMRKGAGREEKEGVKWAKATNVSINKKTILTYSNFSLTGYNLLSIAVS